MKYFLLIILIPLTVEVKAQAIFSSDHNIDSIHARLNSSRSDIEKISAWNDLANAHKFSRADSGLYYASMAVKLSREIGYEFGELIGMAMLSLSHRTQGNYSKSFRIDLEGMNRAERADNKIPLAMFQLIHGSKFIETGDYGKAFRLVKSSAQLFDSFGEYPMRTIAELDIARIYTETGVKDSAFFNIREASNYAKKAGIKWLTSTVYSRMGQAHKAFGDLDSAIYYLKVAEIAAESSSWKSRANFAIAQLMQEAVGTLVATARNAAAARCFASSAPLSKIHHAPSTAKLA
jgi:ATP/maltotriose-dependent transcriptional regulator MalT